MAFQLLYRSKIVQTTYYIHTTDVNEVKFCYDTQHYLSTGQRSYIKQSWSLSVSWAYGELPHVFDQFFAYGLINLMLVVWMLFFEVVWAKSHVSSQRVEHFQLFLQACPHVSLMYVLVLCGLAAQVYAWKWKIHNQNRYKKSVSKLQ